MERTTESRSLSVIQLGSGVKVFLLMDGRMGGGNLANDIIVGRCASLKGIRSKGPGKVTARDS